MHLWVGARRADGLHSIESVMQRITLADSLSLSRLDIPGRCEVCSPYMALPRENTLTRAYARFCQVTGVHDGVRVRVVKRIPAGSGLGGGSADAAALLCGLDTLFGTTLSARVLREVAYSVGSDVPFFLASQAACVLGGGEQLVPLVPKTGYLGLLVCPGLHSGSAQAYEDLDRLRACGVHAADGEQYSLRGATALSAHYAQDCARWRFFNSLDTPVQRRYPVVALARWDLARAGACFTAMSGSGSAVFGLYRDEEELRRAHKLLAKRWCWCVRVRLCG